MYNCISRTYSTTVSDMPRQYVATGFAEAQSFFRRVVRNRWTSCRIVGTVADWEMFVTRVSVRVPLSQIVN